MHRLVHVSATFENDCSIEEVILITSTQSSMCDDLCETSEDDANLATRVRMMSAVSIREIVLIDGTLKGMGKSAPCLVRAVKVSLPSLDIWKYVKAEVFEAPEELPLGKYEVNFQGRRFSVKKTFDGWLSGSF